MIFCFPPSRLPPWVSRVCACSLSLTRLVQHQTVTIRLLLRSIGRGLAGHDLGRSSHVYIPWRSLLHKVVAGVGLGLASILRSPRICRDVLQS